MTRELSALAPPLADERLLVRARERSEHLRLGFHQALKKGSGLEFAGHRSYFPGDDLRHLDRHALARHGRLLLREFFTESARPLHILFDHSVSMAYQSSGATTSKLMRAALLAACFAEVGYRNRDPVGLTFLSEGEDLPLLPRGGREHIEHIYAELERIITTTASPLEGAAFAQKTREIPALLPRAATVVFLSDFLDPAPPLLRLLGHLGTQRRTVVCVQILDPAETEFPFSGPMLFEGTEFPDRLETDASRVKNEYLANLAQHTAVLAAEARARGGFFVRTVTNLGEVDALLELSRALGGGEG